MNDKEKIIKLERDLAEADRRGGELERENSFLKDSSYKREQWLRRAKQEAGYDNKVSFDLVWSEILAKYGNKNL